MKLNARLYNIVSGEPKEIQTLENGKTIEVYSLNQTPYCNYYTTQRGEFALFSTLDGNTYRLLIEDGYYDVLGELYNDKINLIWEQYVVDGRKIKFNYGVKILFPFLVLYLAVSTFVLWISKSNLLVMLCLLFVLFIGNSVLKNYLYVNKMRTLNINSTNKIKETVGSNRFEELLDIQEAYTKKYLGVEEFAEEIPVEEDDSFEEEKSDEIVEEKEVIDAEIVDKEEESKNE